MSTEVKGVPDTIENVIRNSFKLQGIFVIRVLYNITGVLSDWYPAY